MRSRLLCCPPRRPRQTRWRSLGELRRRWRPTTRRWTGRGGFRAERWSVRGSGRRTWSIPSEIVPRRTSDCSAGLPKLESKRKKEFQKFVTIRLRTRLEEKISKLKLNKTAGYFMDLVMSSNLWRKTWFVKLCRLSRCKLSQIWECNQSLNVKNLSQNLGSCKYRS